METNSFLIRAGEIERRISYVVSGLFRHYYLDLDVNERIKTIAKEGDFVVSYSSLLTGTPTGTSFRHWKIPAYSQLIVIITCWELRWLLTYVKASFLRSLYSLISIMEEDDNAKPS
jgi:CRP-like cAMP-binding protein